MAIGQTTPERTSIGCLTYPIGDGLLRLLADQVALALEKAQLWINAERKLFYANLVAEFLPQIWDQDREKGQKSIRNLQDSNRSAMAEIQSINENSHQWKFDQFDKVGFLPYASFPE